MTSNTRNLRHGHLKLIDGALAAGIADAANFMLVPIDEGNLTFDESTPGVIVKARGGLNHWSKGEEQPVNVSFTIKYTGFGSKTTQAVAIDSGDVGVKPDGGVVTDFSVPDFLTNRVYGSVTPPVGGLLTSTNLRNDNFTCDLEFTIDNPVISGDENEVLTFSQFKCESLKFSEGAEFNSIAVSGRANIVTPSSVRA